MLRLRSATGCEIICLRNSGSREAVPGASELPWGVCEIVPDSVVSGGWDDGMGWSWFSAASSAMLWEDARVGGRDPFTTTLPARPDATVVDSWFDVAGEVAGVAMADCWCSCGWWGLGRRLDSCLLATGGVVGVCWRLGSKAYGIAGTTTDLFFLGWPEGPEVPPPFFPGAMVIQSLQRDQSERRQSHRVKKAAGV